MGYDRINMRSYIELEPETEACVETQAKRQYRQILSELLAKGEDEALIEKLEALRLFLESTDFGKLRSESERHLKEGERIKFILYLEEEKLKYEMKIIYAL
ncbi:MAG: hypothetical protein U9N82_02405 [Thermodesulfobacteriota bacterium]|nr:hypothetical protein [Thermodesulfobacteriota bacterium]